MLDIAINNSNRLARLVDDILSLERLESGKVELIMELCQVNDLMQQAIDSVSPLADQAAITLSMTPCTATLHAAPDAIVQWMRRIPARKGAPGWGWLSASALCSSMGETSGCRVSWDGAVRFSLQYR